MIEETDCEICKEVPYSLTAGYMRHRRANTTPCALAKKKWSKYHYDRKRKRSKEQAKKFLATVVAGVRASSEVQPEQHE